MTTTAQPPITDNPELWLQGDPQIPPPEEQKRFSFMDVILTVARQKSFVLWFGIAFAIVGIIYSVLNPRLWESAVTLLPPEQSASRGMGSSMQDLSAALASSEGVSFKSSEDFWAAVLHGRAIADDIIKTFNLQQVYQRKTMTEARAMLASRSSITSDRAGLLSITVQDTDRNRAADIANGFVTAMHRLEDRMALTDAGARRMFFEREFAQEKDALADAEVKLAQVEKQTGVISLGAQTSAAVGRVAELRAQISSKQIEMRALETSATSQNPEVRRMQQQIDALQAELSKTEVEPASGKPGELGPSAVPQATLDYIRATRDVRYHEILFEAIERQVEAARMDEARTAPVIQVVDPAVPAEKHSGLSRPILVLLMFIGGIFFGIVAAIIRATYRNLQASPENGPKLRELQRALSLRS